MDTSLTMVDIGVRRELAIIQLKETVKGEDGKARDQRDLRQLVVDAANARVYIGAHAFDAASMLYMVSTHTLQVGKTIEDLGQAKAPGIWLDEQRKRLFVSIKNGENDPKSVACIAS